MFRNFVHIKALFFLIFIVFHAEMKGQEFKLFDINTDEYPVISAKYMLTDKTSKKIVNLRKEEVVLTENGVEREILYLKNPAETAMPLSILLVFDISGSMKEKRMKIAKEAAKGLIDEVDLSNTEIAISTFNFSAFLNCDFTSDSTRLINAINAIVSGGGTSYDDAFLSDLTGGIEIARQGKYKKVIIFMTDGLGNTKADTIIQKAKEEDITIFTTTVELDMPPVLKEISEGTNGFYFSQVNDAKTSKTIYSKLYRDIIATEYGIIKWVAAEDCEDIHNVFVKTRDFNTNTFFELPVDSAEGLVIMPSSLFIRSQEKDSMAAKYIRIASPHKPISITNITSTNPNKVNVELPELPLMLKPGDNYQLKLDCAVKGGPEDIHQVKIYTENCMQRSHVDIQYGIPGKIEVIKPAAGDIYGAGTDTVIRWTGISKNQPVALFYKYGNTNWQKISVASGLKYEWKVPYDTSRSYQIMAKPADENDFQKLYEIPGQIRDIRIMDVSNDGNLFITQDLVGMINVWQDGSSRPLKTFRFPGTKFIYFSEDALNLLVYNNLTFTTVSLFTNAQEQFIHNKDNFKIFAAHPTLYGDEYLLPCGFNPKGQSAGEFKDIVTSELFFEVKHGDNPPLFAAKCANEPLLLIMNRDYSLDIHDISKNRTKKLTRSGEIVTKAYINPNGKYVYTEQSRWKGIIETNRGRPVINIGEDVYIRFSPDGDRLLTIDNKRYLSLWDLNDQVNLVRFPHASYFNFSHNGKMFYMVHNDTVTLFDIDKRCITKKIIVHDIRDISISQDGSEVLITSDGKAEIYDCVTGGLKFTVVNRASPIAKAVYAENSKIITTNQDRSISIWEPSLSPESGLSGEFSVISPLPDVKPGYDIGTAIVGQNKEVIFDDFITNNSEFPIRILRYDLGAYTDNYELISNPPPFTLKPKESVDAEIRFSPSDTIKYPTSIFVVTPGGDIQSKIVGKGIDKKFALTNKIVDFGKIELDSKKDTTVTLLKNISNNVVVIKEITNSGPDKEQFSILTNTTDVNLKPGEALNIKLRYSALHGGRTSGGLKIMVDEQVVAVQLFGEGLGIRAVNVRGITIDQDSIAIQSTIICAEIKKEKQLHNQVSDTSGRFNIALFAEGSYILYAEKEGYISASENIDVTQPFTKDTIEVTIMLSKVEKGSLFRLNGVFFEFGRAGLTPSSKTDLDRVLQLLQRDKGLNIEIHGHTDNVGAEATNLALSKARANAVKNYFVKNGISSERLTVQYFGETKPVATNATDEGRQLNRRVEFLIKE